MEDKEEKTKKRIFLKENLDGYSYRKGIIDILTYLLFGIILYGLLKGLEVI